MSNTSAVLAHPSPTTGSQSHRSSNFVLHFLVFLVSLFVLISVVISIAWSVIHPIPPVFTLNSLSISNFTLSSQRVKAYYNIQLSVKNPSKKASLVIDEFDVRILYGKTRIISETPSMEPVMLGKMGNTSLSTSFPKKLLDYRVKGRVFDNINEEWSGKVLNLNVEIHIRTEFRYGFWPPKEAHMRVFCNNLDVEFLRAKGSSGTAAAGTGKLKGGARGCFIV